MRQYLNKLAMAGMLLAMSFQLGGCAAVATQGVGVLETAAAYGAAYSGDIAKKLGIIGNTEPASATVTAPVQPTKEMVEKACHIPAGQPGALSEADRRTHCYGEKAVPTS
jgi:hypothetical protein